MTNKLAAILGLVGFLSGVGSVILANYINNRKEKPRNQAKDGEERNGGR